MSAERESFRRFFPQENWSIIGIAVRLPGASDLPAFWDSAVSGTAAAGRMNTLSISFSAAGEASLPPSGSGCPGAGGMNAAPTRDFMGLPECQNKIGSGIGKPALPGDEISLSGRRWKEAPPPQWLEDLVLAAAAKAGDMAGAPASAALVAAALADAGYDVSAAAPAPALSIVISRENGLSRLGEALTLSGAPLVAFVALSPDETSATAGGTRQHGLAFLCARTGEAQPQGRRLYATIVAGIGIGGETGAAGRENITAALLEAYCAARLPAAAVALLEASPVACRSHERARDCLAPVLRALEGVPGERPGGTPSRQACAVNLPAADAADVSAPIALARAAIALYQRVVPPTASGQPGPWDGQRPYFSSAQARPWINPEFGADRFSSRLAAVSADEPDGGHCHFVLEESPGEATEQPQATLSRTWPTEVCLLQSRTPEELAQRAVALDQQLQACPGLSLRDVAYSLSRRLAPHSSREERWLLAVVASSVADLRQKLSLAAAHLERSPNQPYAQSWSGGTALYYSGRPASPRGKLAFVLPGLGAAYPNMLIDLSMHFPYVRAVFDFVELIAARAGETSPPSLQIFPLPPRTGHPPSSSAATLALMDSAVVTVLLAEWAIFNTLTRLGIAPDSVVGCSTGEFAALTMSGAADIVAAAEPFYRLSTGVARAVPAERLRDLRSLRVEAGLETVAPLMEANPEPIYLGAEMTPSDLIVSGTRSAIERLSAVLEERDIQYLPLPAAIPYHTPLVAGAVDKEQKEVLDFQMAAPTIPAWSCSTMSLYPRQPEELRAVTTRLFEKPIMFRQTIEAMYRDGVRYFVEVGPKGVLTPMIDDILGEREHIAIASNLAGLSSLTQLNHVLAVLACEGLPVDLSYLFQRRDPALIDLGTELAPPSPAAGPEAVVSSFLGTTSAFHHKLMETQKAVMLAYLQRTAADTSGPFLPFLRGAGVSSTADAATARLRLTLDEHLFLLDHAIGGASSTGEGERVHLLPLMVALEMMAETASLLAPHSVPIAVADVRAYKRIRVGRDGVSLTVSARLHPSEAGVVAVEILPQEGAPSRDALMSCTVRFAAGYPPPPLPPLTCSDGTAPARLDNGRLYGPGAMFHGPRMQSVRRLNGISGEHISAVIEGRPAQDWFAWQQSESAAPFLIDPLLLDNATHLTLLFLLEKGLTTQALLPYHARSIEFFSGPPPDSGDLHCSARMAVSDHGTRATVEILDGQGAPRVRISDLMSRRITLPDPWAAFLDSPATTLVSSELDASSGGFTGSTHLSIRRCDGDSLPADDTTVGWLTDYILSPSEQEYWSSRLSDAGRRRLWLLGRIAAKDAVRILLKDRFGILVGPAEVEIVPSDGAPAASGSWSAKTNGESPVVSISHSEDVAVALASWEHAAAGIDVERVKEREDGFENLAFRPAERKLLDSSSNSDRQRSVTRMWSAREATGKALGKPLSEQLRDLEVIGCEGRITIVRAASGTSDASGAAAREFVVRTIEDGELIISLTTLEEPARSVRSEG